MNPKSLVRLSNVVGIVSIILLIYWVFTFIVIEVFGLKVFRENMTETFYLSVVGILALMSGSLIVNIMFNLTRIAEKHNSDPSQVATITRKLPLIFGLLFPAITAFLFLGDYLTAKKKERVLIANAKSIVENYKTQANRTTAYEFTEEWLIQNGQLIDLISSEEDFPYASVITQDSIKGANVFLEFTRYVGQLTDEHQPKKRDFIFECSQEERHYLESVLAGRSTEIRFTANDGNYELFYPYHSNGRVIVFHFTDYQRYGKLGS